MAAPTRKHWLDWQRGLAVLFMIEVHILSAWSAQRGRVGHERRHDPLMFMCGLGARGVPVGACRRRAIGERRARRLRA